MHVYVWHLEIFWLSDKVMYMKVLTHPILLEKQLNTIFLKKASQNFRRHQVVAAESGRWSGGCSRGTPGAIFQRQNVGRILFPICKQSQ